MPDSSQDEREVRAARNQALFRAVNEKMNEVSAAFSAISDSFTIACECADVACVETLQIDPRAYEDVRSSPRTFAVLSGHVYPDVEKVVAENKDYVVVEKTGQAADVLESTSADRG